MKKLIFALLLCAGFALPALGQSTPPTTWQEADGSPKITPPKTVIVPNGSISGRTVTITGGGGSGCTPPGTANRVLYDNGAGGCTSAAGFTFNGSGTISLGVAGSSVGAIGFRNATSGTITLQPVTGALGTVTLSLPAVTDTLVGLAATQTLTNKTLTTPVIAQISNTGTLTLPTSTDTLVGRATTDTLTNKTLSTSNTVLAALTWAAGVKQTFAPDGTNAGINVGSVAGDPSAPANGDLWYDSTANELTARINGANVALGSGGGGGITIGATTITSGTNTRVLYNNAGVVGEYTVTGTAGNVVLSASPTLTGTLTAALATFAGSARSSGVASYFAIQTPADTGQTASTESIGMQFGGNSSAATVTRQWATGALTTQRENVFVAPTYSFVGASTLTTAATVAITAAPVAGTNATITNSRALLVQSGDVQIQSGLLWFAGTASNQGGLREWGPGGEVGGVAAFQGSNSVLSGSIVGAGFYTNQFANNNSSITIAINRTNGVVLGSDLQFAWQSATSGGTSPTKDTGLARVAASVTRFTNGSTGAGSLVLGTSTVGSIGTSGVGVLAIANGTAPSSSPADEFQLYSADSAAGDANAFILNEAGERTRISGLSARVSTQFDKTSDTTLANVTGLTRNVEAGRTYAFTAVLYTTSNVAGGVKAAIGGTATATSIIYQADVLDGSTQATVGTARATSLATTVGDVTAVTAARITISGTIVVNAAGTLVPQFAQNASNGTASSVLVNSSFQLIPIS